MTPFLKETKTSSLFCLRCEVLSKLKRRALTGQSDLSELSDLSQVAARAGITTEATLSGPSLVSWFFERKLSEG